MTAAIYCARKQLSVTVLTEDIGGQTLWSGSVENYLGYEFIKGVDLVARFEDHLKTFKIETIYKKAVSVTPNNPGFTITDTAGTKHGARAVIVATGKSPRMLGVPDEAGFRGKGVTYCATCDAPLFAGMDVAVAGGGNSGLDAAVQLVSLAKKVYLIEAGPRLIADEIMVDRVRQAANAEILMNTTITALKGTAMLESIIVKSKQDIRELSVQGLFVEIGLIPNSGPVKDLVPLNELGEIKVDRVGRTDIAGLFAAGDVTDMPDKQIIVAAGEGAKAALTAYDYLMRGS